MKVGLLQVKIEMMMLTRPGKGKITDMLSQQATLCCRAAGGHSKLCESQTERQAN